jgi:hypothetical protein
MKFYTNRPKRGTAQIAWDYLLHGESKAPVEMWRAHLTYWVWVMKFTDGSFTDVDCLTISCIKNKQQ